MPPHVTFEDLRRAAEMDEGVIPFTGIDPSQEYDLEAQVRRDVALGAKGMKLHPIIQNEALTSERTRQAVQAFAPTGLPVLLHTGVATYYLGQERGRQNPDYGQIHYVRELVAGHPDVPFIIGHSGLRQVDQVLREVAGLENAYAETSFMSPDNIRKLLDAFGARRVLFGSDWPWAWRETGVRAVKFACGRDSALGRALFHDNAARLLRLSG